MAYSDEVGSCPAKKGSGGALLIPFRHFRVRFSTYFAKKRSGVSNSVTLQALKVVIFEGFKQSSGGKVSEISLSCVGTPFSRVFVGKKGCGMDGEVVFWVKIQPQGLVFTINVVVFSRKRLQPSCEWTIA